MSPLARWYKRFTEWCPTNGAGMFIIGVISASRGLTYILTEPSAAASPAEELLGKYGTAAAWILLACLMFYYCFRLEKPGVSIVMGVAIGFYTMWGFSYIIAWAFMPNEYPRVVNGVVTFMGIALLLLWGFSRTDRDPLERKVERGFRE